MRTASAGSHVAAARLWEQRTTRILGGPGRVLRMIKRMSTGLAAGLVCAFLALSPLAAVAQQPPATTAAQEGFVPIDQLAPKEEMPAAPLVMAAYAVAWLVIFGYVWSLWRRLQKVELEIADVSRRVASGGRR
jgi:CcmD family protein